MAPFSSHRHLRQDALSKELYSLAANPMRTTCRRFLPPTPTTKKKCTENERRTIFCTILLGGWGGGKKRPHVSFRLNCKRFGMIHLKTFKTTASQWPGTSSWKSYPKRLFQSAQNPGYTMTQTHFRFEDEVNSAHFRTTIQSEDWYTFSRARRIIFWNVQKIKGPPKDINILQKFSGYRAKNKIILSVTPGFEKLWYFCHPKY